MGVITRVESDQDHEFGTFENEVGDRSYGLRADGFSADAWVRADGRQGHRSVFVHDVIAVEDDGFGGFTIRTENGRVYVYLLRAE